MTDAGPSWTREHLQGDPHADPEKASRVQSMFTAIARSYDLNNRIHSFGLDQAWRRRTVREVARRLGEPALQESDPATVQQPLLGRRVLDVACGTGDLTALFGDAGAEAIGGDYTPAMLEIARRKGARRGASLRYVEADAMRLPFVDASFDAVSIAFGLRNVAHPARAMGEFFRVLRPGGALAVLEFDQPSSRVLGALHRVYTQRVMPLTASLIARDRSGAYRYLPRSVSTFLSPRGIAELATAAGFERVEHIALTFGACALTVASRPAV
jgi:demethylmenaquinone methyltransferase/2-methoxy-6-polyprenyl-1,4-benzoquinol methylase